MREIQNGDLLLTHNYWQPLRPLSYLPPAIRLFTGNYWNHTANVLEVDGELMVVEADWPRCTMQPLEEWLEKGKKDLLVLRPHTLEGEKYRKVLMASIGVPYDFSALFEQAQYHLFGRRRWRGRTEATATGKYYCSELSAQAHNRPNWWLVWPGYFVSDPAFYVAGIHRHPIWYARALAKA